MTNYSTIQNNAKQAAEKTGEEVKETGKETYSNVRQAAKDAGNTVREVAKDAGNTVREFFSGQSEKACEMKQHAEEKIVKNPLQSVALAALGGLLLGALSRR